MKKFILSMLLLLLIASAPTSAQAADGPSSVVITAEKSDGTFATTTLTSSGLTVSISPGNYGAFEITSEGTGARAEGIPGPTRNEHFLTDVRIRNTDAATRIIQITYEHRFDPVNTNALRFYGYSMDGNFSRPDPNDPFALALGGQN